MSTLNAMTSSTVHTTTSRSQVAASKHRWAIWLHLILLTTAPVLTTTVRQPAAVAEAHQPTSELGRKVKSTGDEWIFIGITGVLILYAFGWLVFVALLIQARTQQATTLVFCLVLASVVLVCFDQIVDPFKWH